MLRITDTSAFGNRRNRDLYDNKSTGQRTEDALAVVASSPSKPICSQARAPLTFVLPVLYPATEYLQICRAVAMGFAIMGFLGFTVKLIHLPINQILVGSA